MGTRVARPAERSRHGLPDGEARILVCSFCHGTGKDPFGIMSALSSCCVCGGKGVLRIQGPHRGCPHCQGSGAVKTFTCGVCRGTGYLVEVAGPTVACPECQGTGDAQGDAALGCLKCRGQGRVPASLPH
jgi:DnaJ-class molecular chaperone